MLGFFKRHTRYVNDTKAIMILYNGLLRSILEYCFVIWQPTYTCNINRIKRAQHINSYNTFALWNPEPGMQKKAGFSPNTGLINRWFYQVVAFMTKRHKLHYDLFS
ncbi:unnamed protein product [Psylliodes chrysocephalus]|uniref:Uncharacterized protein n=1 Tax=Psylliodes chrysocephalus TaxID=3402493 RepID=A0A9P0CW02_9CUCU|nr:unnamed protein product [Psylliodes chrysocephala]